MGSWLLHGRPWAGKNACGTMMRFKIDPEISKMKSQFHEDFPINEFPLNGSEKPYVPLLHACGSAKFRCIQRTHTLLVMETRFPDGLVMVWRLQMLKSGMKCKLEITNMETGVVGHHFFVREDVSAFPSKREMRQRAEAERKRSLANMAVAPR